MSGLYHVSIFRWSNQRETDCGFSGWLAFAFYSFSAKMLICEEPADCGSAARRPESFKDSGQPVQGRIVPRSPDGRYSVELENWQGYTLLASSDRVLFRGPSSAQVRKLPFYLLSNSARHELWIWCVGRVNFLGVVARPRSSAVSRIVLSVTRLGEPRLLLQCRSYCRLNKFGRSPHTYSGAFTFPSGGSFF